MPHADPAHHGMTATSQPCFSDAEWSAYQADDRGSATVVVGLPRAERVDIASGEKNLAWRAADAFLRKFGGEIDRPRHVAIDLRKEIPAGAGLGGGSSDAGAVLRMMATLCRVDDTSRLAQVALALGAEFGAGFALVQGADPQWSRLLDNFAGFCERARRLGLTASLEFVPQRDLATLAQALQLITEGAQPNAAICIDPLHLARGGGAPADLRNLDLRLFPYIQFSDGMLAAGEPDLNLAKRIGVGERRLPGRGMLPLDGVT